MIGVLKLFLWDKRYPRLEWEYEDPPPYEWEIQSLHTELVNSNGHWLVLDDKGRPLKNSISGVPYSRIIQWLYFKDKLKTQTQTKCGMRMCLNPDHYQNTEETVQEVVDKDLSPFTYTKGPPEVTRKNKRRVAPKPGDVSRRMKCITRKIWYPNQGVAGSSVMNNGMRPYKCNMCDGWHLTHKGRLSKKEIKRRQRKMPYS